MQPVLNAVAGFLVGQSWQIFVVFGLVVSASWVLRNASAHWRYLLWLVVVAKCVIPPMINVPLSVLPPNGRDVPAVRNDFDPQVLSHNAVLWPSLAEPQPATFQIPLRDRSVTAPPAWIPESRRLATGFRPLEFLVMAWMLIAGMLLTCVAAGMWATHRRLRRMGTAADEEIQREVATLATAQGMQHVPAVRLLDSTVQPFVWGWVRGDIYLPRQFAVTGTAEQRRAILTHELAHVLRSDAAVNHFQNIVQSVFFFHPLIWLANQKIRQEREKCCDEIVLSSASTSPKAYCGAIVDVLNREYRSRQSTPALAVTGSTRDIKERITTMLTPNRKFLRQPSRATIATMLLFAACVLPTTVVVTARSGNAQADEQLQESVIQGQVNSGDTTSTKSDTWPPGQTMDFRVINAQTKEPLSDVTLELQNMGPGIDFGDVKIQKTDADGWSRIPLPDLPPTAVRVYPVKEGFVPLRVYWAAEPHPTMPKSITIPMEPGRKFGGMVCNEAGEPISDVTVTIDFWADGKGENPHIRANINAKATTDKDGRWQVDVMPAEIDNETSLRIYVHHPDYVSDHLQRGISPLPITERPSLDQLFDQSAVMVMREGETVEGTVVDRNGDPIPNAAIYDNRYYWFDSATPRATTDESGEFRFTGVEFDPNLIDIRDPRQVGNRGIILTVEAAGYAPELIFANPHSSPLEVQLDETESIHGQVVDEAGKPVEGVTIGASQWRGQADRLHLESKTDAEGRFQLTSVPTDEVKFGIGKEGYTFVSDFPMTPSPDAYNVILKTPVRIVGSVTDAETGKPLEKFSLMSGIDFQDGRNTSWIRWDTRTIVRRDGRFETTLKQEEFSWRLRVEADGYMPAESRIFQLYAPDRGDVTYDFQLTKADSIAGLVLGLDEKPLRDAVVYLSTEYLVISNRTAAQTNERSVKTDAAGRFQFPPEVEPFCLVVVHEQGIAMLTEEQFEPGTPISIKAWNAENETMQIVRKPARGQSSDFPVKYP